MYISWVLINYTFRYMFVRPVLWSSILFSKSIIPTLNTSQVLLIQTSFVGKMSICKSSPVLQWFLTWENKQCFIAGHGYLPLLVCFLLFCLLWLASLSHPHLFIQWHGAAAAESALTNWTGSMCLWPMCLGLFLYWAPAEEMCNRNTKVTWRQGLLAWTPQPT